MTAVEHTADEIAELVRAEWEQRPNEIIGPFGGQRFNLRVDHAIRAVAVKLGMDWRLVLRAYRLKHPLRVSVSESLLARRVAFEDVVRLELSRDEATELWESAVHVRAIVLSLPEHLQVRYNAQPFFQAIEKLRVALGFD